MEVWECEPTSMTRRQTPPTSQTATFKNTKTCRGFPGFLSTSCYYSLHGVSFLSVLCYSSCNFTCLNVQVEGWFFCEGRVVNRRQSSSQTVPITPKSANRSLADSPNVTWILLRELTNCPLLSSLLLFHRLSQILLGWATIVSNNREKEVMSISEWQMLGNLGCFCYAGSFALSYFFGKTCYVLTRCLHVFRVKWALF